MFTFKEVAMTATNRFITLNPKYVDNIHNGLVLVQLVDKLFPELTTVDPSKLLTEEQFIESTCVYADAMKKCFELATNQNLIASQPKKRTASKKINKNKWDAQLHQEYIDELNNATDAEKIMAHSLGVKL